MESETDSPDLDNDEFRCFDHRRLTQQSRTASKHQVGRGINVDVFVEDIQVVLWLSRWFRIVRFDSVALFLHPSKSKRRDV